MTVQASDLWEPYYDQVTETCLVKYKQADEIDPLDLLTTLMHLEGLPMHCPVHHYIMPALFLTAVRKKQGHQVEVLERDLVETEKRARNILPGFCGFYGACGAAVGLGVFFSMITDATPYSPGNPWAWANKATGQALLDISEMGGPRCCKRTSYRAFQTGLSQIENNLGISFNVPQKIICTQHELNAECLRLACPYYPVEENVEKAECQR